MATPTYDLLESITLTSETNSVIFQNIDQSYGDLIIICDIKPDQQNSFDYKLNNDNSTTVSFLRMRGDVSGSTGTGSNSSTGFSNVGFVKNANAVTIMEFLDYSATDKHKAQMFRTSATDIDSSYYGSTYQSTAAITQIEINNGSGFGATSKFSIYGIAKVVV